MSHLCLIEAVEVEGFGGSGVVAAAFGDMQVAGVFDGRDDGGADGGQVGGPAAGTAGGGVFAEGHVTDVVVCLDGPVLADQAGQILRRGLSAGQAGDGVDGLAGGLAGGGVLPPAGDLDGLARVGEVQAADVGGLQGAGLDAAVPGLAGGAACRYLPPGQGPDLGVQQRLVPLDQEGDRLRRFRALLPCEVVVTAVTHPLHGCRLRAYAVRHVDGVPHLKVELPDGMPGLVAAEATDALGAEPGGAGAGLVLDGDGLRRLRAVVMRLQGGDVPGPGR